MYTRFWLLKKSTLDKAPYHRVEETAAFISLFYSGGKFKYRAYRRPIDLEAILTDHLKNS